jgi:hypothetical protein
LNTYAGLGEGFGEGLGDGLGEGRGVCNICLRESRTNGSRGTLQIFAHCVELIIPISNKVVSVYPAIFLDYIFIGCWKLISSGVVGKRHLAHTRRHEVVVALSDDYNSKGLKGITSPSLDIKI